ncbi:MAG: hypothetical protein A2W61_04825 [Deltaproteobacteria bacterium RIFCSPLOWO2_01_44_7]|nr:MAG: hypothetical protein A2712_07380 [Deltaproteobacteria bacterium RIFCSPHIGHO2_01_FULL_43_49]OGQ15766.1 MAG: hypothetical protein A3D22_06170 [Deltaproteobacteria bacterium RIFCSPHIGHO2_02_FULL_44_53]OGQ29429.1 MAG: hypothetical protein A3D98_11085 [Deltaproteobacteria bacterium RIFCSPHIGHO2_12_FULL_44_21]OGQ32059.1 MAG: hypothetical protein A2979_03115 [Deltaproteobacteria bacterium RIFCSPLOWO2_01_FULL_45_74]OGQ40776.1 MAG: hypothetical protein A2W61_04825 [Deltaproteobacteria bacterium 
MQVLVIDDEEGIRSGLQLALEDSHKISCAASASEGIEAIQAQRPDIILLDMFMGQDNGDVVLDFLDKQAPEIPVVIISAFSTEVLEKKFGNFSKQWIHYRKPIDIVELRKLLDDIEKKKLQ